MGRTEINIILGFTLFLAVLHKISCRGIGVPVNKAVVEDILENVSNDAIDYALYNWFVPKTINRWARLGSDLDKDDLSEKLPPILRGKKSTNFFPFPEGYYQNKVTFNKPRNVRSTQQSMEKSSAMNIPWEMRYFSPMLRG